MYYNIVDIGILCWACANKSRQMMIQRALDHCCTNCRDHSTSSSIESRNGTNRLMWLVSEGLSFFVGQMEMETANIEMIVVST